MGGRVETDVQLPLFVRQHITPAGERTRQNPLDFQVYRRGNLHGIRQPDGSVREEARCDTCRCWKPAYHFPPITNSRSGIRKDCYDCYNAKRRTPERRAYMKHYQRERRANRRHYQRVGRGGARDGVMTT
jgi:hypothetical protein